MGRNGVSYENKLEAVEKYKRGKGSLESIAKEYGVAQSSIRRWLANYEAMDSVGLTLTSTNSSYSPDRKRAAVEAYLRGEGSYKEICKRYSIRSNTQLRNWIKAYNGHKELRATGGRERGIYMTKGRTTTLDERIEIVSHCITSGKDYAASVEKYGVSYQQIYSWVSKRR